MLFYCYLLSVSIVRAPLRRETRYGGNCGLGLGLACLGADRFLTKRLWWWCSPWDQRSLGPGERAYPWEQAGNGTVVNTPATRTSVPIDADIVRASGLPGQRPSARVADGGVRDELATTSAH